MVLQAAVCSMQAPSIERGASTEVNVLRHRGVVRQRHRELFGDRTGDHHRARRIVPTVRTDAPRGVRVATLGPRIGRIVKDQDVYRRSEQTAGAALSDWTCFGGSELTMPSSPVIGDGRAVSRRDLGPGRRRQP